MAKRQTRSVRGTMTYLKRPAQLTYRESKPWMFKLQMVRGSVIKNQEVIAYAAQAAHVPETTVAMAMNGLFDAINYYVTQGRCVQVKGLGSFKPNTKVKVAQSEEDCTADSIIRRRIQFYPRGEIADMARYGNITFCENKSLTDMACGLVWDDEGEVLVNADGRMAVFDTGTGKFKYVKEGGVESFESVTPTEAKEGAYVSKISGNTQTGSWQYGSHVYTVANGKITDLPAYA